jgi:hypothetical protein
MLVLPVFNGKIDTLKLDMVEGASKGDMIIPISSKEIREMMPF